MASEFFDSVRAVEVPALRPVFGRSTWNSLIARGVIPSRKVGRARLVKLSDVDAFLEGDAATAQAGA